MPSSGWTVCLVHLSGDLEMLVVTGWHAGYGTTWIAGSRPRKCIARPTQEYRPRGLSEAHAFADGQGPPTKPEPGSFNCQVRAPSSRACGRSTRLAKAQKQIEGERGRERATAQGRFLGTTEILA